MILIASAAYVNSEFQIEFGRLPPAFLPIGNRQLFERQIEKLQQYFPEQAIYLSLPASYKITNKDALYLERHGVQLLHSDENLCLADAIAYAIDAVANPQDELRLLHGDTLLTELPTALDVIGIVETSEDYQWEAEASNECSESVWCGYFSFSDAYLLKGILKNSGGSFTRAVRAYDFQLHMTRERIDDWYDFGHINTYFRSRARITTERAFNTLIISDGCVRKSGYPPEKIIAEGQWFKGLPNTLRSFCPQLIDFGCGLDGDPYYILEYLPLPPLNEIFVHGKNPVFYWDKLFSLCSNFLQRCAAHPVDEKTARKIQLDAARLAEEKTKKRLREFFKQTGFPGFYIPLSINGIELPALHVIIQDCLDLFARTSSVPGVLHGDFCLSNILFDSRSDQIKVIDPRGLDASGKQNLLGDLRYDLAKLTHSVIGLYDHIVAGGFDVQANITSYSCSLELKIYIDSRIEAIQSAFIRKVYVGNLRPHDMMPLTVLLFLSMLPLHADDKNRQMGLFANALRLYEKFVMKRDG